MQSPDPEAHDKVLDDSPLRLNLEMLVLEVEARGPGAMFGNS